MEEKPQIKAPGPDDGDGGANLQPTGPGGGGGGGEVHTVITPPGGASCGLQRHGKATKDLVWCILA